MAQAGPKPGLKQSSAQKPRNSPSLIAAGLENTPHEILLFDRLLNLLKGSDEVAIDVQKFLEENITSGTATGVSHLVLGTALYELGNVTEADFHLEPVPTSATSCSRITRASVTLPVRISRSAFVSHPE